MIVTIMNHDFIDRENELELINQLTTKETPSLLLLYGRRRIGKTRLIQEIIENKNGTYFYTPNSEEKNILAEYSRTIEHEYFQGFQFNNFNAFLNYLDTKLQTKNIIAIDEFQRLANIDGAISQLQRQWDQKLSKGKGQLILSGSSIGAMHKIALNGDAPLYGRRTATIKLTPLKYRDLKKWFTNHNPEEQVKIYGSFGGTPAYLEYIDEKQDIDTNIITKILQKNAPLYNEPETLLMEELRAPQRYMDILTAIAQGRNKITEISNNTGINRENISTYLKKLETLDLTERIVPITEPKAKKGIYKIKDPFFQFWFRFVRPNKRQLELGLEDNIWTSIKEDFNQHLGSIFEDTCREIIAELGKKNQLPIRLDRVGRWWKKDTEIDILGFEKRGKTLIIEVKWSTLSYRDCKRILNELSVKTSQVPDVEEPILGVMAKQINDKEKIREDGFWAMDLNDLLTSR